MGDEPGDLYLLCCPTAHHDIRWVKGYSPAEVPGSRSLPRNAVVPGTSDPDIQHTGLQFDGDSVHQWEDRPQGLIHRSSFVSKPPLDAAVTQLAFYDEHQSLEGPFHAAGAIQKAFKAWNFRNPVTSTNTQALSDR